MKINHKEIFASINKHKEKKFWTDKLSKFDIKAIVQNNTPKTHNRKENYGVLNFEIANNIYDRLMAISNNVNNNLFIILFSEIVLLTSKILNKNDLIIGCPILKQNNENIINKILPVRNTFNEDIPYKELLNKTKNNIVESFENQDYSIYSIIRDLELPETEFIFPLFDVAVLLDNIHDKEYLSDLNLNLIFRFNRTDTTIQGIVEYNTDNLNEDLVKNLISNFNNTLEQTLFSLDVKLFDVEILSKNEKDNLLFELNKTENDYPKKKLIHQLFEEQALRTPNEIALEQNEICLNYSELNSKSNELAKILIEKGVGANDIIGLILENSFDLLISIWGILKAGAAYLPIDVTYPSERKSYIINDSKLDIIITNDFYLTENLNILHNISFDNLISFDSLFLENTDKELPERENTNADICYVIYTSGSTGKPKGTLINHRALVNYITWATREYEVPGLMNFPLYSSISFDLTVTSIFLPLINGYKVIIYNFDDISETFSKIFNNKDIGVVKLTPSHLVILKNLEIEKSNVKKLIIGGEQLTSSVCNDVINILGKEIQIYNEYGPTETVVGCMIYKYNHDDIKRNNVSIGKPASNTQIYLLDNRLNPVSKLSEGEIYIGGDCISRGYLNQADLTEERFIDNPYKKGGYLYKTGDLAKWLPDGNIEFIKRIDEQVKIRGFRVELGEIEKFLLNHKHIKSCVVILRNDEESNKYLCAYIVLHEFNQDIKELNLKGYLADFLPDYMIPLHFVEIENIPLTTNGKVNKELLPKPELVAEVCIEVPSNEIEQNLVKIWSDILNVPQNLIGVNSNFFELGGHSLLITLLVSRIHKEFNVKLLYREVFNKQTIKQQYVLIHNSPVEKYSAIIKAKEKPFYVLSSAQKRLYLLQQMDLDSTAYNISGLITLPHTVDKDKVETILRELILRHESFRTSFEIKDELPIQVIQDKVSFNIEELSIERDDLDRVRADFIRSFDLSQAPLLRALLLRVGSTDSYLLVDMHHIISDGESLNILEDDFHTLYKGEELSPLSLQYKDYSEWQNSKDQQDRINSQSSYWLDKFSGDIPVLNLPLDNIRPSNLSNDGNMITVKLSQEQTKFIQSIGKETSTTLYMNMLSVFSILLLKLSGQDEFVVGQSDAGRKHSDLQKIVGMFVNSLPIKVNLNKNKTYKDFLSDIKKTTLIASDNQEYQFDELVKTLGIKRQAGHNPVFDVMVNMTDVTGDKEYQFDVNNEYQFTEGIGRRFDLTLNITNSQNGIFLGFQYYPEIFNSETIVRFAQYFKNIVSQLEEKSDSKIFEIDLLTKEEKEIIQSKLGEKIVNKRNNLPISFHQERIWFIDKFEKNNLYESSPVYHNIPLILDIEGEIDSKLLEQSIQNIISRHDILRSKFYAEEEKLYHEILEKENFLLKELFVKDLQKSEIIHKEIYEPFDFENDLLFRASLITESEKKQILLLVIHHIISDKYSLKLLAKEIIEYYQELLSGKSLVQIKLPIQFANYIYWQRETYPIIKDHLLSYWKPQLKEDLRALVLPEDTKRAKIHIFKAGEYNFEIQEALTQAIYEYANLHNFSIELILLGFYKILLGKYANQKEIAVGTSVDGRSNKLTKALVGPVANLIVLKSIIDFDDDFTTYLTKLDRTIKESYEYKDIPFDQLVSEINPVKDMSRTALFDILFQYEEYNEEFNSDSDLKINQIPSNLGYGKYDQNLLFQKDGNTLKALLVYNTEYFRKETIVRFFDHYIQLISNTLKQVDQKLSETEIITEIEKQQLLHVFNNTNTDYPREKTIHQLFEEQVERTPNNIALKLEEDVLTYSELNEKANGIAHNLRNNGIDREDIVAVLLDRSFETIYSMLGILKAGGVYLPLDPDYPIDRIDFILSDSNAKSVITTNAFSEKIKFDGYVINTEEVSVPANRYCNLETINKSSDLCYIIYTSGTTGQPKGVMVEHRNVVRLFINDNFQFDFSEKDVWTMFHSHCFDFSVWEMYGALLNGGKLIIVPKIIAKDAVEYYNLLNEEKVTVLNQTPSAFYNLAEIALNKPTKSLENIRYVIFGGEALKPVKLKEWFDVFPDVKLINMFGITETTVHVTYKEIGRNEIENNISNIGTSIPTLTTYVMDKELNLVPIGVSGELLIGGEGVSRGYLGQEALTKERFVTNPYNSKERLYRSGDQVKMLSNGELEYIGRIDDQVQIRGFRIELGEIENVLLKHENIKESAVIAREYNGDYHLCAYIVCKEELNLKELRIYLSTQLPDYMIPSYFIEIESIPLTTNGKVNSKILPEPTVKKGEDYVSPRNALEKSLANIWANILEVEEKVLSVNSNFFEIGGHSLRLTTLASRIHKEFDINLQLKDLFLNQTISDQSIIISNSIKFTYESIEKAKEKSYYDLSSAQKRLYLLQQFDLESTAYNISRIIPLPSTATKLKLESVLQQILQRHEAFRTSFETIDETPVQKIHDKVFFKLEELHIEKDDLERVRTDFEQTFDLCKAPLFRALFLRIGGENSCLLIDMHHIISDGTSQVILENDFNKLYEGKELSPLLLQYRDYSEWLNSEDQKNRINLQSNYWLDKFSEDIPVLDLPQDFSRPAIQSFEGSTVFFRLSLEETQIIKDLCVECDVTLYMSVLGVLNVLLSRLSGQKDIIVGTPIAARRHSDLEGIVGMFVNTLAMRNYPNAEKNVKDFYDDIKRTTLEAYENQEYQFEDLVEAVSGHRDASRNPLFDVVLNLLNQNVSEGFENEESDTLIHKQSISKFDLTLSFVDVGDHLEFNLEYCTKLFRSSTIDRFIAYFRELILSLQTGLEGSISELNMITSLEREKILYDFNNTEVSYPKDKSIHQLFEEQVLNHPDSIAVISDNIALSYKALNQRSNQLARKLKSLGLEKDTCIGLMTDTSLEMVIGILGILKSACYYMPIDTKYPELRKQYMLDDGNVKLLLTQKAYLNSIKGKFDVLDLEDKDIYKGEDTNINEISSPGSAAYVMYTSGSTGNSKGVIVEHKNVVRLVLNTNYVDLSKETRILQTGAIVFDATTFENWGALLNGGSLFLTSEENILNSKALFRNLENYNINTLWLSSSLFNQLLDQDKNLFKHLTYLLVGGDKLSAYHINKVRRVNQSLKVINGYGPTENTTFSACYQIDKDFENNIPIGKPINNTTAYILDTKNEVQAIGVVGELYFGLDGVSRGYLNNPELTDSRFVKNPYVSGGRLYKTGDLARWLPDGNIEFLGRIDSQVKIRGFRIETGEIEVALLNHESVKEAVVIVKDNAGNNKYLCAYVVLRKDAQLIVSHDLRDFLSTILPEYMIPSYFIEMESIPLTTNGKLNKRLLPEPSIDQLNSYVAPRNETEEKLVKIWSDVLEIDEEVVSVNGNFFELGGHSLKAAKLIAKINSEFKLELSFVKIFNYPTIGNFGEYISKKISVKENIVSALEKKEYYELCSAQRRLYFIQELDKSSISYNMPLAYILHGEIDKTKFENTFRKIVQRHEVLRTSFIQVDNKPVQIIHDKIELAINYIDADVNNEDQIIQDCIKPFDLKKAPLFRIYLVKTSENRHILVIDMHHIISDGTSLEILISDFNNLYNGNDLPKLLIQFKDYAIWYNKFLESETVINQEKFWVKQFEDKVPQLDLPIDFSWEDKKSNHGGAIYRKLDNTLVDKLKEFIVENETTMFQFLLSIYNIMLSKCSSQEDIVIGSPIVNRKEKSSQNIIGLFVNMVSFRNAPKGDLKYSDFLFDLKNRALDVFSNQDYPFEKLVSKLRVKSKLNRHPIFDAVLAILNVDFESNNMSNSISVEPFIINRKVVQHDLLLSAFFTNNQIELTLDYSSELFKESTVKNLMDYLVIIIEQVIINKEIMIDDIALPHSLLETIPSATRDDNNDFGF